MILQVLSSDASECPSYWPVYMPMIDGTRRILSVYLGGTRRSLQLEGKRKIKRRTHYKTMDADNWAKAPINVDNLDIVNKSPLETDFLLVEISVFSETTMLLEVNNCVVFSTLDKFVISLSIQYFLGKTLGREYID